MHELVALPTWHSLNDGEQRYLRAVVAEGGTATPRQIAQRIPFDPATLSRTERHLVNAGCVTVGETGAVEIAEVITLDDMRRIAAHEARYADAESTRSPTAAGHGSHRPRCNAEMPRAQARCVLAKGHAGRHRSR